MAGKFGSRPRCESLFLSGGPLGVSGSVSLKVSPFAPGGTGRLYGCLRFSFSGFFLCGTRLLALSRRSISRILIVALEKGFTFLPVSGRDACENREGVVMPKKRVANTKPTTFRQICVLRAVCLRDEFFAKEERFIRNLQKDEV